MFNSAFVHTSYGIHYRTNQLIDYRIISANSVLLEDCQHNVNLINLPIACLSDLICRLHIAIQ